MSDAAYATLGTVGLALAWFLFAAALHPEPKLLAVLEGEWKQNLWQELRATVFLAVVATCFAFAGVAALTYSFGA